MRFCSLFFRSCSPPFSHIELLNCIKELFKLQLRHDAITGVEIPDSCPDFKGRDTSGIRPKLSRAVGHESVYIPKFGRDSLNMGRERLDIPNMSRNVLVAPPPLRSRQSRRIIMVAKVWKLEPDLNYIL